MKSDDKSAGIVALLLLLFLFQADGTPVALLKSFLGVLKCPPFKIILDWFHQKKKCKDLLSMAINGKQVKNQVLTELLAWLWLGKVHRAIKLLQDLSQDQVKNTKELHNLIIYLDRNSNTIPCYALRKKLG